MSSGHFLQFVEDSHLEVDAKAIFVAMPFSRSFDRRYHSIIKEPLEEAGFSVFRTDEIYGTNAIMANIVQCIQKARLVIADVTGRNPNVLFELGLACGLGKDILLLTSKKKDIPADLRHLTYAVITDVRSKDSAVTLRNNVEAVLKAASTFVPLTQSQRVWINARKLGIEDIVDPDVRVLASYALKATERVEALGLTGQIIFHLPLEDFRKTVAALRCRELCIILPRPGTKSAKHIERIEGAGPGAGVAELLASLKRFAASGLPIRVSGELNTWGGLFVDGSTAVLQFYYPGVWKAPFVICRDRPGGLFQAFYRAYQEIRRKSQPYQA